MMKLSIWSIGRTNEKYLSEGIGVYIERLKHYCRLEYEELKDVKPGSTADETTEREAAMVLARLKQEDTLILLDEKGKMMTSEKLADYIADLQNRSTKNLVFLIGGAYGHHRKIRERASDSLSLSHMTFTHQMARLILAEQLYRAYTIIKNEKYHNR